MRTVQVAGLMALCATLLGAQGTPSDDATAIRTARRAQNAAMAAGDVDRTATYWTEDVSIRSGLGFERRGIETYRQRIARAPIPDTALVYERVTNEVNVSARWPLAFETGTWTSRAGGKGPSLMGGRYSAQWVKRDGRWLIRSEVFVALTCSGTGCGAAAVP